MNHTEPRQQLEERIQQEKNNTVKIVLLQQLADASAAEGELEYALQVYRQALQIARKLRNNKLECDILTDLGSTAESLQETDLAIDSYQKALKIAQKMQNFIAQSDILGRLGILHMRMGNIDLANEYFNQAADAADIAELSPIIADTPIPKTAERGTQLSTAVQKSIAVSNEIKQLKRLRTTQRRITIVVDILLVIVLIIIRGILSGGVSNTTLLLLFSFFAIIAGVTLTYRTFFSSLKGDLRARPVGRSRRR